MLYGCVIREAVGGQGELEVGHAGWGQGAADSTSYQAIAGSMLIFHAGALGA